MNQAQSQKRWAVGLVGLLVLAQMASGAAEPNGIFPNDPLFPLQWYLHNTGQLDGKPGTDINAVKAWEITTGDPNIIIADIGEGIDLGHPDLVNNLVQGRDFFDQDDSPYPGSVSGLAGETMTAGLIAAEGNNGLGVAGVTWHCKIMPVRVFNTIDRYRGWPTSVANEAAAWRWAATHGTDVICHGWLSDVVPTAILLALHDITKPGGIGRSGKGCVFVTAARAPIAKGFLYYGRCREVISVDDVDPWDRLWWPHEAGSRVDLVAPAGCPPAICANSAIPMWSTDVAGPAGTDALDYTDQAAASHALVAGVAALILSVEPDLANEEVRHYLCRSAHDLGKPGWDVEYGWGRVDARAALDMVLAKRADLNNDWVVNENDLAFLTAAMKTNNLRADIAPATKRDGVIDAKDETLLRQYLGTKIPPMPEPGLFARWALDETEGEIAYGSEVAYGGMTPDAALHGAPIWQPASGRKGGTLLLDGVDDYVETPAILDPAAEPFSVFVWIKGGDPGQVILAQKQEANWLMAAAPQGTLTTELKGSGRSSKSLASSAVITDGAWHRVGLTWDGQVRTLYVDGVQVARDAEGLSHGLANATGPLCVGAGSTLGAGTFWSGLIDDVCLYDRAVKP